MLLLFLLRGQVTASYRPMRGQVVIQETPPQPSVRLWTPTPKPREVVTHTGRVLALGPPARTACGAEVPHGFGVGDLVLYRFTFLEKVSLNEWDGVPAHWIPQQDVTAVWEEDPFEKAVRVAKEVLDAYPDGYVGAPEVIVLPGRIDEVDVTISYDKEEE